MISPRWRKVLRDLWLHKSRTILVVLAISVGIIGAGAVLDTWSLVRNATRQEYGSSNPASATLRTDSVDDALLNLVRRMPEIRLAESRRNVSASVLTSTGWRSALLMASPSFPTSRIGIIKQEEGDWPPPDGAMVVERSSVDYANAAVGDRMQVRVGDNGVRELRIAGIARDVGLAPGWMEHVVYIFVTPETLAELGAPKTLDQLQIVVADRSMSREQVRAVANKVKAVVESTGRTVKDITVPIPGRHIHAAQIDSLLYTQGAFGLLALLLSGFLVINLVSAMLAGQVREIGVMKAIGAEPRQIAAMYLALALALGVVASVIAIPVAAVIGRLYARFTADLLNFDVSSATIPPWIIAVQLATGILLPLVAASIPIIIGTRIPVSEALRDFGIGSRSAERPDHVMRMIPGLGRPTILSLRNAFRRRARMFMTLITLATGGAVYLGAINLRASVVKSVDSLFGTQNFDMVVRFASPHAADSLETIVSGIDGVAGVEGWNGATAAVRRQDGSAGDAFPVTAPPANTKMLVVPVQEGRWLRSTDTNPLVVNRKLVELEPSLEVGTQVTLTIKGQETMWTVVGLTDVVPSPAAYTSLEALAPLTDNGRARAIVIKSALPSSVAQFDLLRRVRLALTDGGFVITTGQLMLEQRAVIEDHLLMVAGFLGIMAKLIIVVGGLGLASTMSIGVLERTREIGVLRAIGAPHRAIFSMIQVEGLVIAVLSWLAAIPLSIPMSVILAQAFARVMIPVPIEYVPELSGVLIWLAIVVGVSVVACAWPALRAMRVTAARALAYE
jgi:putative ABC transport system permease protein